MFESFSFFENLKNAVSKPYVRNITKNENINFR